MARLTRKNIKVFAENATNNGVFGSLQAENPVTTTNVEQIQSLPAWSVGWNLATMTSEKLPPLEEFQGIQYVTTYQQAYLMQEGMPEWASTVTYYKGSLAKEVTSNGFRIYCSLTNDNTNNLLSDTSNWKKVMDSSDLYAFDNAVVHIAGTETITGSKTFSSQIIASAGNGIQIKGTNHNYVMRSGESPYEGCSLLLDNDLTKKAFSADASKMTIGSSAIPAYANVPSGVTISTSNEQIATCGWVNSVGNNVVHLSGTETITGTKTFSANPNISNSEPNLRMWLRSITKGTAPATSSSGFVYFRDSVGTAMGNVSYTYGRDKTATTKLRTYKANAADDTAYTDLELKYPASGSPYVQSPMIVPNVDNAVVLGNATHRWQQLYAGTTTIATSDERLKQQIERIPDEVLNAWGDVEFYRYKFNEAVAAKGAENARYHIGLVAQRIEQVFATHNLNAFDYGLICFDEWQAQDAEVDAKGDVVIPERLAGNRYSLRYEECLVMEAEYQRRRADKIEARLAKLEARL